MPFSIVVLIYIYRAFLGESLIRHPHLHISGHNRSIGEHRLIVWKEPSKIWASISTMTIVLLAAAFVLFKHHSPHLPIFQDPISSGY